MRLEEQAPKYVIGYTPNNIDTLKHALKQYAELVESGKAFKNDYCAVLFEPDMETVPLSLFEPYPNIHRLLESKIFNRKETKDNLKEGVLTEVLLFACALRHPELEADIKQTCQAFVNYARRINDSSKMWITAEEPFAINPLLLVASVYPKYGYLLASFMVPYWDDEHMLEPLGYLHTWSHNQGITEDTLKAFCYCDNTMAREYMLGYDTYNGDSYTEKIDSKFDLIDYFRSDEANFARFKEILAMRFADMPFLQYTNNIRYFNNNPIESIVLNIMFIHYPYDTWNDDEFDKDEYLTQTFVQKPAEVEIEEIKQFVEGRLGHPITSRQNDEHQEEPQNLGANRADLADSLQNWRIFITEGLENGETIWDYVLHGGDTQILTTIPQTNLYKLANKGNFDLFDELDEMAFDMDSLWEDLEALLIPLYAAFKKWSHAQELSTEMYNGRFLRFLDVLFALNRRKPFVGYVKEWLISDLALCSLDEFTTRFHTHWINQLEAAITKFSGYSEYVNRKDIEACWNIIHRNREEVKEKLPQSLFNLKLNAEPKGDIVYDRGTFHTTEILVVAAYVAYQDQRSNTYDELTRSALNYIDHHSVNFLWDDLYDDTDFPEPDLIEAMESDGDKGHLSYYIPHYQSVKPIIKQIRQFVEQGYILKDGKQLSDKASEKVANEILQAHLKFEDEEISTIQKQVHWLRNFSHKTQKLLYVAHLVLAYDMDQLSSYNGLKRMLKFAFELGPIRTSQLLAKLYKPEEYKLDTSQNMFSMLDKFRAQGLSLEGYWGYVLEQYADNHEYGNTPFYKSLLEEWLNAPTPGHSHNALNHILQQHRTAIAKGYELLPREKQLSIIDHASEFFPKEDFTAKYDHLLVDRISRELKKKFKILDFPVFFKNRLQYEGHYCEYIQWSEWDKNPKLLEQLLHHIEIEKPEGLSTENCKEQLQSREGWKYIVLQKQGDKLVPIFGLEELWLIQNGFTKEDMNEAQTFGIIIDENCPKAILGELTAFSKEDHKSMFIRKTMAFLAGDLPLSEVALLFRCGIYEYEFLGRENYYDIALSDMVTKVNPELQQRTFQMLGLVSYKCLELDIEIKRWKYLDLLMNYEVDPHAIFKYFVWRKEYVLVQKLARIVDISPYIPNEKIADQIPILSVIAPFRAYHPFILSLQNHKSAKLSSHIENLITKLQKHDPENTQYLIVDFGVYKMEGSTEPEKDPSRKTAREPVCINQSEKFEAKPGMFFGFRFTAMNTSEAPKILAHKVEVKHPVPIPGSKQVVYHFTQWQQNGYSDSKIFLGWNFETEDELVPGEYTVAALDLDGKLMVEKTFFIT